MSKEMEVEEETETKPINFHELELDDRILKVQEINVSPFFSKRLCLRN